MRDLATAFMIGGFLIAILGIALWSVPAALMVAGVVLFVSGGLEHRYRARQQKEENSQ